MMDLSLVPYESRSEPAVRSPGGGDRNRYRECMRNHAASMGGHAFDGCGEFMPACAEPLKCAACGCHRSFHRRDGCGEIRRPLLLPPPPAAYFPSPFARMTPAPPALAAVDRSRSGSETPPRAADGSGDGSRKRMRTKFTAEQKEKMQAFAERMGWRIGKQDDVALEEFCVEIGVKRHVLKVWMHNNKNHLSSSSSATSAAAAAAGTGGNGETAATAAAISV